MSLPQDVFGASPKTVLNKPFFHAQYRQTTKGAHNSNSVVGYNNRKLNTVLTSEIAGASLADNVVTLPAGEYYVEAFATVFSASTADSGATLGVYDADAVLLIMGGTMRSYGDQGSLASVAGKLTFAGPTDIKLMSYHRQASSYGLGFSSNHDDGDTYVDLRIWKLDSDIDTPVLSDPTMTLARPLMHIQDQKTTGTGGGDSIVGDNIRDLNTVLTNEISGASLVGNEVTLPAGTYYIESHSNGVSNNISGPSQRVAVDGSTVLVGTSNRNDDASTGTFPPASVQGRVVLTQTSTLTIVTRLGQAVTGEIGLGRASGYDPYEVYTDVRIWQMDAVARTPVLVNDKLFPLPGNVQVTGNMYGLDYAKTGANEVTIQPGACMNSTNEVALQLASAQALSIPAAAKTVYSLFLCDDGFVRQDTDPDGANLVGYKIRWIGFVRTDEAGILYPFTQAGDSYTWGEPAGGLFAGAVSTTPVAVDLSVIAPAARVKMFDCGCSYNANTAANLANKITTSEMQFMGGNNGSTSVDYRGGNWVKNDSPLVPLVTYGPDWEVYTDAGTGNFCNKTLILKR